MYHFFPVANGDTPDYGDLARHYQTLADQLQLQKPSPEDDIRMTELVVLTADMQAQWLEKTMALIRRLYPKASGPAQSGIAVCNLLTGIEAQANSARDVATLYRAKLATLWTQHPQYAPPAWHGGTDALHAYDHLTYPLGQLMQMLPGDITNQPSLSMEEIDMCHSASALAFQAQETLLDGLEALGQLQEMAEEYADERPLPPIGKLIGYLSGQSRFMALCGAEYRAAAENVRRR